MWLRVSLPTFQSAGASARITAFQAREGEWLAAGTSLVDLTVDLSGGVVRDCPPVSTCRIILREPLWLRRIVAAPGSVLGEGAAIALFSTQADSPEGEPVREARVTIAAVLHHADWWNETA